MIASILISEVSRDNLENIMTKKMSNKMTMAGEINIRAIVLAKEISLRAEAVLKGVF
jgi:hypothetical protein